jgi:hypothetical protein
METCECQPDDKKSCCLCRKIPGVFIVLIGVTLLLAALDVISRKAGWIAGAILVILLGLQKICAGMCNCCNTNCDKK